MEMRLIDAPVMVTDEKTLLREQLDEANARIANLELALEEKARDAQNTHRLLEIMSRKVVQEKGARQAQDLRRRADLAALEKMARLKDRWAYAALTATIGLLMISGVLIAVHAR